MQVLSFKENMNQSSSLTTAPLRHLNQCRALRNQLPLSTLGYVSETYVAVLPDHDKHCLKYFGSNSKQSLSAVGSCGS